MFTNNYINYKALMFHGGNTYSSYTHPTSLTFVWTIGDTIGRNNPTISAQWSSKGDFGFWLPKGRCRTFPTDRRTSNEDTAFGIYFGSGSTPATKADYKLEKPITSGLRVSGIDDDYLILQNNGKYEAMVTFLLKNTSDAEINVYEIGAVTPVGNSSSSFYPVLMERTVLAEPVTIPAGGTRALEYRVIINQF